MSQTYIKGKDCPLETTIETLSARLAEAGFAVEEASWLNPVPHAHSVHIREADCPLLFTNGKGASRKACLASALGEFVERLANNYFFADFYLGPDYAGADFVHYPGERWFAIPDGDAVPAGLLDEELLAVYDPDGELRGSHLVDTNSGDFARGVCALPYTRQRDGAVRWFPVNLIGNLYVSNGMSAGNTPEEAQVQGLAEVFERGIKNRIIAEGLALPRVPEEILARFPAIREGIAALEAAGYGVRVCDASLGGRYPVMNVTLLNPADGGVFASFGAHPTFEIATERALTELLQGRDLDRLQGFPAPTFDDAEVADPQNLELHFIDSSGVVSWDFLREEPDFPFVHWNLDTDNQTEREALLALFAEDGHDVFIADYTHLGAYACRILVPGFSEVYPAEELVVNNNNEGALVRHRILNLEGLGPTEWGELLEELEAAGHNDFQPVAEFIGIAPDPGTLWAELRLGELKAMLALACGDREAATAWVQWCLLLEDMPAQRAAHYRCIQALLEMAEHGRDPEAFRPALAALFGEAALAEAESVLAGDTVFPGLSSPGPELTGLQRHQALLRAYATLQKAKGRE